MNIYITLHINNTTKQQESQIETILNQLHYIGIMNTNEWINACEQLWDICNLADTESEVQ